jgi:HAD superfamily hydrolase (TIGR01549 family)
VTNKPRIYSEALLLALNLTQRCAVLVCPDDVSQTKPHPEPMYLACKQLNVDPRQTVYIGDHLRDIQAGKNAK